MTAPASAPTVLRVPLLSDAGLHHGFTTRAHGDFAWPALQTDAGRARLRALGAEVGFDPELTITADQVHGATVAVVHLCENCGPGNRVPHTDGLITEEPWPLLLTAADCFPVILLEPESQMVAIVHAGWRGAVGGILARALARLVKESGGKASEIRAGIGPGICAACYEVGPDVVQAAFSADLGAHVSADADMAATRFDIAGALRQQLLDARVQDRNIDAVARCTFEDPELPSFRRDGTSFRAAAVVALDKPAWPQSDHYH
ncbi:MAG: polyphenol oxidase family protein [Candidatus Dormiibacterota bacterium]